MASKNFFKPDYSTKQFKIVSCPSKDLVFENCVFLSKSDASNFGHQKNSKNSKICENHVELISKEETVIFSFKPHQNVENGNVGLSMLIRQSCKANTGDLISLQKFIAPPNENLNLVYAKFKLSCLSGSIETDEDYVQSLLLLKLKGRILSQNAVYIFDIHGEGSLSATVIELKVAEVSVEDKSGEPARRVKRGILSKHVYFEFDAMPKGLKLSRSKNRGTALFGPHWSYEEMGIGGLDKEFTQIFRRAFASRTLPPNVIKNLGIDHVRGLLLHGPPGTGKTLIARQIGKMLRGREPKVVNGPEILNKYVGQSEENIRALFIDAEEDFNSNGENADLHIIIFDEIDAICKQRGTTGGGTGVHDTVVNQLLSKMDGVDSLNNILVIGMTNRKDMIDSALLRPGRFEVLVEIGLPDKKGREEILLIHTNAMREHGFMGADVNLKELAEDTKNFSGAEISGLVKSATSFAYYGSLDLKDHRVIAENVEKVKIDRSAFQKALEEVHSAFGMSEDVIAHLEGKGDLVMHGETFTKLLSSCKEMIEKLKKSTKTPLLTILLEGRQGTGKTALAAHLTRTANFPFAKVISPEDFVGWDEVSKCSKIREVFEDAHKSPLSMIVLDNIERLLGFVDIGPRFSNLTLQTLLVLLKKLPPIDKKTGTERKLCVIGTTSEVRILEELGLKKAFMSCKFVPEVGSGGLKKVLDGRFEGIRLSEEDSARMENFMEETPVGIKSLLTVLEMAIKTDGSLDFAGFEKSASNFGIYTS